MQQLFFVVVTAIYVITQSAGRLISEGRRVVGGKTVDIRDYPYMAAILAQKSADPRLYKELRFVCGGSILSPNFVLTAAHCTFGNSISSHVRYASADRNGGFTDPIKAIHRHPKYNEERGVINDIAIAEIEEPIVFNNYVSRATLSVAEPLPGEVAIFSGWGKEKNDGVSSRYLRLMYTTVQSRRDCKISAEYHWFHISPAHVCANNPSGGHCYGDSGGPLMIGVPPLKVDGQTTGLLQVGIASVIFGNCADRNEMDVYTSVAHHKAFIDDITHNKTLWGCQFS